MPRRRSHTSGAALRVMPSAGLLFESRGRDYEAGADGQRFLVVAPVAGAASTPYISSNRNLDTILCAPINSSG